MDGWVDGGMDAQASGQIERMNTLEWTERLFSAQYRVSSVLLSEVHVRVSTSTLLTPHQTVKHKEATDAVYNTTDLLVQCLAEIFTPLNVASWNSNLLKWSLLPNICRGLLKMYCAFYRPLCICCVSHTAWDKPQAGLFMAFFQQSLASGHSSVKARFVVWTTKSWSVDRFFAALPELLWAPRAVSLINALLASAVSLGGHWLARFTVVFKGCEGTVDQAAILSQDILLHCFLLLCICVCVS